MFFFFYFSANGFGRSKLQIDFTLLCVQRLKVQSLLSLTNPGRATVIMQGLPSCFTAKNRFTVLKKKVTSLEIGQFCTAVQYK